MRRRILRLKSLGLVSLFFGVSGIQYDEKPGYYCAPTVQLLDLIRQVQNSNLVQTAPDKENIDPLYRIPQRCRPERIEAAKRLMRISDHDLFVRKPKPGIEKPDKKNPDHWQIDPSLRSKLWDVNTWYDDYTADVKDRKILFRTRDPAKNDVLTLPYRTRFTDDHRKIDALTEFETAFTIASKAYQSGVFLTLTTAPPQGGWHPSLWHANRHFGKAWNRYTSLLARRKYRNELKILKDADYSPEELEALLTEDESKLPPSKPRKKKTPGPDIDLSKPGASRWKRRLEEISSGETSAGENSSGENSSETISSSKRKKSSAGMRPIYLAVYEFQENGLLHSHIIIFGIRYLEQQNKISKDWERCGQGSIVKPISIKNDNGVWNWRREQPADCKGQKPEAYLKKYLKKALFGESGFSLYWSVNKRFSSMSRRLQVKKNKPAPTGFWKCLGSWKENEIPLWVYEANRGAPVLANWGGWEIMKRHSPGEPAF
ncbi:MAG: hypothetical protein WC683_04835 [bacterium]